MRTDDQQKMIDELRFNTHNTLPIMGNYGRRMGVQYFTCALGSMALALGAHWNNVSDYLDLDPDFLNDDVLKTYIIQMNDKRYRKREFVARFLEVIWPKGD